MEYTRKNVTLHIHSINRLGSNLVNLQTIVDELTTKGAIVQLHKENLTYTGKNDHTQTLLFQVLGAVAQFERALIKERQAEGIAAAKVKGKHLGRPAKFTDEPKIEIKEHSNAAKTPSQLSKASITLGQLFTAS